MWWGILKRDMSYCVCSGPNKTKGFTCKAHCRSKQMKRLTQRREQERNPKAPRADYIQTRTQATPFP